MAPLITSVVTSYDQKNKNVNGLKSNDCFNVSVNKTFFPENSSDKLSENCLENSLKTSKSIPEAFPEKPEIANQPVRKQEQSHDYLIRDLKFACSEPSGT